MKLKVTLVRQGGTFADVLTTVDAGATIGDLADHLAVADPTAPGIAPGTSTVAIAGQPALERAAVVAGSGLRSGQSISLVADQSATGTHIAAAVVRVVDGPDAGREFPLPHGTSHIGRDASCEVVLSDALVSRSHARVNVTDVVEIVDLGSANGVLVGGALAPRVVLAPGDTAQIGDTTLSVTLLAPRPGAVVTSAAVDFNRSPRLDPQYAGVEHVAPEAPQPPQPQRFPLVALVAPVILGALLYLITKQIASLAFIALSPLLLVGNAIESRIAGRKAYEQATVQFHEELAELVRDARAEQVVEQTARRAEHPSAGECIAAATVLGPLLWTRRPDDASFMTLRLGLGTRPSRSTVTLPMGKQASREHREELSAAADSLADVGDVPVIADLVADGAVGVAGPRQVALDVARGLVTQLVALHSPAEVSLVAVSSAASAPDWNWLKWLPHVSTPSDVLPDGRLASSPGACLALVAALEELVGSRDALRDDQRRPPELPAVVLLVDDGAPVERSRLVSLAEQGVGRSVHVVWVASSTGSLPAACRTFLDVTGPAATVGYAHDAALVTPVGLEAVDAAGADRLARWLSPVVDSGARGDDESDLPRSVSFLTLVGGEFASSSAAVVERWTETSSILTGPYARPAHDRRLGTLRATVGVAGGEPFTLDLRSQGPHALVGGTTGSGKSEFLQSWILGMAAAHSPQRVTFLLVDYKGGSAFSECSRLPHTVGLVTDLRPYLVRRALTSLNAELRHRERILAGKRAKDVLELERQGDPDAPPSLVIVVDEFAALVQEVPEFVDGVVNVAQRGRSLGLHLVLATQRPAGVIKDNLRANTNMRLALRVADEADSVDVLGSPQAAGFDPSVPGRAVSKTGPGRLTPFQAAYVGGWTPDVAPKPDILVEQLGFGSPVIWALPEDPVARAAQDPGPTDLHRLVETIRSASGQASLPGPRLPWLPELASTYDLALLPSHRRDADLVFGVRDDPDDQAQPTVSFRPDTDGNLAVFGTGGTGKSTLLRTIAAAAGYTVRGGPCQVYGIDFGARGLHMLEDMPHVGSIVSGEDHERISRLVTWLREVVDERAARYSAARAGSITKYRELAEAPDEPRILLLVDGLGAFRQAYEVGERSKVFDTLLSVAADGRPVGAHLVVSADRPGVLPSSLGSSIQRRVVLRLADENDYVLLGLPSDVIGTDAPAGRGLLDGSEVQVGVLGGDPDVVAQAEAFEALAATMRHEGVVPAHRIDRLTDAVLLEQLPVTVDDGLALGVAGSTLGPAGFVPRGSFLVTGPPGSGRTTATATLARSVARARPETRMHLFAGRRSPLLDLDLWSSVASSIDESIELAESLASTVGDDDAAPVAVFVESVGDYLGSQADFPLQTLLKACLAADHLVVVEGDTSSVTGTYPLLMLAKNHRTGLALQPDQLDGAIFRAAFPRLNRIELPPGRAMLVTRGVPALVHVATS